MDTEYDESGVGGGWCACLPRCLAIEAAEVVVAQTTMSDAIAAIRSSG